MSKVRLFLASAFLLAATICAQAADEPRFAALTAPKIKVLLIYGGHGFEQPQFFNLFKTNTDITLFAIEHPNAHGLLRSEISGLYDVLVLYDLWQDISDRAKSDFVDRLKDGKGLVVLHHALCSYQKWPEYSKIIGGRYYLDNTTVDGVEKKASTYKHDLQLPIHVADTNHPVTQGIKDFEIHDEAYKGFDVFADAHPLLTNDSPESSKVIAWSKTYENSRVVYLQLGHDHFAYENPNYQKLLRQAIRWAAKRD